MRRFAAGLVVAAAVVAAAADDPALKDLQGEYTVKALEKGGRPAPPPVTDAVKEVSIKGDTLTFKVMGRDEAATIKLDPAKRPAAIDLVPRGGPDKGRTILGVYKFEDGELTIVHGEPGDPRPAGLDAKGNDVMKLVFVKKAAGR